MPLTVYHIGDFGEFGELCFRNSLRMTLSCGSYPMIPAPINVTLRPTDHKELAGLLRQISSRSVHSLQPETRIV